MLNFILTFASSFHQAPETSPSVERSSGLFDVRTPLFRVSFTGTVALFGVALAAGTVWHYWYWLPHEKKIDQQSKRSKN